jgi:uncharacterized protein (TIGR02594 family)
MKEPIWLSVAFMLEGIQEIPGPQSHPLIMKWVRDIGAPKWYDNDDKAWCAILPNRVLLACQLPMARHPDLAKRDGYDLLRAATFEHYGQQLTDPTYGCILTFRRPGGDHVGFYLGESATAYYVYGGNQSNKIGRTWIAKDRCTSIRYPPGVTVPLNGRVHITQSGQLSTNED